MIYVYGWLDKDPQTLVEAAKLADPYTVNHHNHTIRTENKHYNNNSRNALPFEVRVIDQDNASHQNKMFHKKFGKDKYKQGKQKTPDILPPLIQLFVSSVIKQTI